MPSFVDVDIDILRGRTKIHIEKYARLSPDASGTYTDAKPTRNPLAKNAR